MMRTRRIPIAVAGAMTAAVALGGCDALNAFLMGSFGISGTPVPGPSGTVPTPTANPTALRTPEPTAPPAYLRTEVLTEFKTSPYLPLFTSPLINDGIGIFADASAGSTTGARRWGRDYKEPASLPPIEDMADVYVAGTSASRRAIVITRRRVDGIWLADFPWRKSLVKKAFQEEFQREALFEYGKDGWQLAGLSVATRRAAGATVGITEVQVQNGAAKTVYRKGDLVEQRIVRLESLASGLPGEPLTVSVTASGAAEAYVIAGGNRRQRLTRDGTGISARFTGTVPFPDVQGIGQIGIDVIATRTLEVVASEYDAALWGVPVARKGGAQ